LLLRPQSPSTSNDTRRERDNIGMSCVPGILAHPASSSQARGLHDIWTRNAGDRRFVELHLEVDSHLSVAEGHRIADEVEHAVRGALPDTEVIVYQEPAGIHDERLDDRDTPVGLSDSPVGGFASRGAEPR
jgi:hypothetical protein